MLDRALVGVVNLLRIVAAARESVQLVVAHVRDHRQQLRIFAEELPPNVVAALRFVGLVLAVHHLFHPLHQQAGLVAREQPVPIAAPDHFDDVPAGAAEGRLQLLDDFAVAAHRTVEALQIAVDHEDQVVELLA